MDLIEDELRSMMLLELLLEFDVKPKSEKAILVDGIVCIAGNSKVESMSTLMEQENSNRFNAKILKTVSKLERR